MARVWVPDDVKEKRQMLAQLFDNPHLLPPKLLSFLNDYNALNQAQVPASQIIGISGYLERLDQDTDTVTIQSSTAEATIYSYDVPAGLLQTKGAIQTEIHGTWLQNSGSSPTLNLRIKYGATTMYDAVSPTFSSSANPYTWAMDFILSNRGATNSQRVTGSFHMSRHAGASAGDGLFLTNSSLDGTFSGTATVDSKTKQTLVVTMQTDVSHASNKIDKLVAYTTRIAH